MNGNSPAGFDPSIRSYYDRRPEENRLQSGVSQLEAWRTKEIFRRFAPAPPAVVYDVGGGSGPYSRWLAELGYEAHLLDPVPRLLDVARKATAEAAHPIATIQIGDARDLPYADKSADCVLLLGPLYHLTERADRLRALSEARRVLKHRGLLYAVCITRWASLFDGLKSDYLADPDFVAIMERDLEDGRHHNATEKPGYFTTAYFHEPDEFREELTSAGLEILGLYGLEGPAGLLPDFDERWADSRKRSDIIRAARAVESEPTLSGLSAHLLGVARKPGSV